MTRRFLNSMLLLIAAAGIPACATGRVIVLKGEPSSLRLLAGEWDGTFAGDEKGPSGSVWFSLIAGEDHAHGDVRMTPRGLGAYNRFDPRDTFHGPEAMTYLDIRWVQMDQFTVVGTLDPFLDPVCNCRAETTFSGILGDNRIDGTYTTRVADGTIRTGRWGVVRTKRSGEGGRR